MFWFIMGIPFVAEGAGGPAEGIGAGKRPPLVKFVPGSYLLPEDAMLGAPKEEEFGFVFPRV